MVLPGGSPGNLKDHAVGAHDDHAIGYRGPRYLPYVTDGGLLGRVLDNLIVNAIKHTPRNEKVTLSAEHNPHLDTLKIQGSDTGEGIAEKDRMRLFQKYGRVEGQAMGRSYDTGLGLVFCRMAIDLLGGDISVASEVGKGSAFTIALAGAKSE